MDRRGSELDGANEFSPFEEDRPDISLIVPTRNEVGNVEALVDAVTDSLEPSRRSWELLFVDDSEDDTPDVIDSISRRNRRVRMIHRRKRQRKGGLAGAVTTGYSAARGRALVVMDGDLQHPPDLARGLAAPILSGDADMVIASRYVTGASAAGLAGRWRRIVSSFCTFLVHLLVPASRGVKDPMSGFYAVSRQEIEGVRLKPHGFKILLEVLARAEPRHIMEVPFTMRERGAGQSKAGLSEGLRFGRHLFRLARPGPRQLGRTVAWLLAQIPLGAILAAQTWLSVKLIYRNTAFVDEATYLSAGHYQLYTWAHPHSANLEFPTYFSGAPTIYPVLSALADDIGGLAAARYLSMGFMLLATFAVYACAKRLWGRPAGWLAAGLWVTTQGVQFLGSFATYDAMALMLVTLAAWTVVRWASSERISSLIYLAAPLMVLANATKYASALYDPVIVGLALFVVAYFHTWRSAVRVAATLTAFVVIGITAALALAPPAYLAGIDSTTLKRAPSTAPPSVVMHTSWAWIGVIAVVSAVALLAALAISLKRVPFRHAPDRTRRTLALLGVLAVGSAAVWLAPLNQARIHTETSLSKHVTFGAWFAALAAGWLFAHLLKRPGRNRPRRYAFAGVAILTAAVALVPVGVAGTHQARHLDNEWANSTKFISAIRPLVLGTSQPILMDQSEIPAYYLEDQVALPKWENTFYFAFNPPGTGKSLVGIPAYTAAVDDGAFSVIALDYGTQLQVDHAVAAAIHASGRYQWVGNFSSADDFGPDTYVVWKLRR